MAKRLTVILLVAAMIVVTFIAPAQPAQSQVFGTPVSPDWCAILDVTQTPFSAVQSYGNWRAGVGFTTGEDGQLSFAIGNSALVQASSVTVVLESGAGETSNINVSVQTNAFGIEHTGDATDHLTIQPSVSTSATVELAPQYAGQNSSVFALGMTSSGGEVVVTTIIVQGYGVSPFAPGSLNGDSAVSCQDATGTPTPSPTQTPFLLSHTPTPSLTITPSITVTPSETLTPSETPTATATQSYCGSGLIIFDFKTSPYSDLVVANGTWVPGQGYVNSAPTDNTVVLTAGLNFGGAGGYYGMILTTTGNTSVNFGLNSAPRVNDNSGTETHTPYESATTGAANSINAQIQHASGVTSYIEEFYVNATVTCPTATPTMTMTGTSTYTPSTTLTAFPTLTPVVSGTHMTAIVIVTPSNTPTSLPTQTLVPLPTALPTRTALPAATHVSSATPDLTGTPGAPGDGGGDQHGGDILNSIGDFFSWMVNFGNSLGDWFGSVPGYISSVVGNLVISVENALAGLLAFINLVIATIQQLINIVRLLILIVGHLINVLLGWMDQWINVIRLLVQAYYGAFPTPIPGLPQCVTAPLDSGVCAFYDITQHTLLDGAVGGLIIPILTLIVDITVIFKFILIVRNLIGDKKL